MIKSVVLPFGASGVAGAAMLALGIDWAVGAPVCGCVLAEFRMAPLLLQPHGVEPDEAVAAMLAGLARSALPCGLIVCGMRHEPPERVAQAAELALRHRVGPLRSVGVVGFDLAGPELGWPATRHAAALARVREAGLPITLHAGEADEGQRVYGRLVASRASLSMTGAALPS